MDGDAFNQRLIVRVADIEARTEELANAQRKDGKILASSKNLMP